MNLSLIPHLENHFTHLTYILDCLVSTQYAIRSIAFEQIHWFRFQILRHLQWLCLESKHTWRPLIKNWRLRDNTFCQLRALKIVCLFTPRGSSNHHVCRLKSWNSVDWSNVCVHSPRCGKYVNIISLSPSKDAGRCTLGAFFPLFSFSDVFHLCLLFSMICV